MGARLERLWNISLTLIEAELGSKVRVSNRGVKNKLFVNVLLKKVLKDHILDRVRLLRIVVVKSR